MYQNNTISPQIKDKSYLQRFSTALLYIAKTKTLSNHINMSISANVYALTCIYNILQKYNIDTINMLLTGGLRPLERLRGLRQVERLANRVSIGRTTKGSAQPNDSTLIFLNNKTKSFN